MCKTNASDGLGDVRQPSICLLFCKSKFTAPQLDLTVELIDGRLHELPLDHVVGFFGNDRVFNKGKSLRSVRVFENLKGFEEYQ
jgi:hypothetical protein